MKDFDILFDEGCFVGGQYVTMKIWKIDQEKYPRREYSAEDLKIGFVVSKKVHKSAVKRNTLKRKMREVVRLMMKDQQLNSGFLIALMAKPAMFGAPFEEIQADVERLFQKAKILS